MPEGNPLVAQRQDSTTAYSGLGIVESAMDLKSGVEGKSWLEAGLGAAGTGLEALSLAMDPVGTLLQYAVSWLMEHVKPLSDALDWLAGDADQVAAYAQTWKNVGQATNTVAQDFATEVTNGTGGWEGQAADTYRQTARGQGEQISAAATSANTIGSVVEIVGVLVGAVREIVRDLVAECVATLIARIPQWLAEIGGTFGLATPHVVASAVSLISKWVNRIKDFITKLTRSLDKLSGIIKKLDEIWAAIKKGLSNLNTPSGVDAPSTPNAVRSPSATTPSTTPGGTSPSGAGTPGGTSPGTGTPGDPPSSPGSTSPSGTSTSPSGTSTSPSGTPSSGTPSTGTPGSATPSTGTPGTSTGGTGGRPPGGDPPSSTTTGGPDPISHYDASGKTIPTNDLPHPNEGLLDRDLLRDAENNPNRVGDALRPGADVNHPAVQDNLPDDFDPHGGLGEDGWNDEYWPSGTRDAHGNRDLEWPDPQQHPDGFNSPEDRRPTVLNPGETIDRFGPGFGRYASPPDTPYPQRGLPPDNLDAGYHQYRVVRPIPAWEGPIAPAMGQPGGGTQYYMPASIVDLVNAGYLEEIPL
jgi:hypothetical protein